jgi:hypothetical protein
MLVDRKGWAIFIGTPKGKNSFWDLYQYAITARGWYAATFKASETGIVPADELEDIKLQTEEPIFLQEFECDFNAAIRGAIYGRIMSDLDSKGRITRVDHDDRMPVTTAWDIGRHDSTSIWFVQRFGQSCNVIDYYEASGVGADHYVRVLSEKTEQLGYNYDDHLFPHDVASAEWGSTDNSRVQTLAGMGIHATVVPKLSVDDGINATRKLLPRCRFDVDRGAIEHAAVADAFAGAKVYLGIKRLRLAHHLQVVVAKNTADLMPDFFGIMRCELWETTKQMAARLRVGCRLHVHFPSAPGPT